MSKKIELKTAEGREARCNADMVELQISSGRSLTPDERKLYAIAWRDGCKAALEHAQNELKAAVKGGSKPDEQPPFKDLIL